MACQCGGLSFMVVVALHQCFGFYTGVYSDFQVFGSGACVVESVAVSRIGVSRTHVCLECRGVVNEGGSREESWSSVGRSWTCRVGDEGGLRGVLWA